jgi:hypothetical protein
MKTHSYRVPGTGRMRCNYDDGTILDRGSLYMTPHEWHLLRLLANADNTSGSLIIAHLIREAAEKNKLPKAM